MEQFKSTTNDLLFICEGFLVNWLLSISNFRYFIGKPVIRMAVYKFDNSLVKISVSAGN